MSARLADLECDVPRPDSGRPHILQVVGSGAVGGGTIAVLALARGLSQQGFRVTLASQGDSYIMQQAQSSGIDFFPLDFTRRIDSPKSATALRNYIIDTKVDLAHAHGARAGLPLALAAITRSMTSVYTVHGFFYPMKVAGARQLARSVERFCIGRLRETVFVSRHDQDLAVADGLIRKNGGTIIYNGIESPGSPSGVAEAPEFDIAFLGRLHRQKNPLALPAILSALPSADSTLAVIGDGELADALRAAVANAGLTARVTFFGEQQHADALRLLRRAKVMLLPSITEGLPICVMEAMHLGIPVVASRIGGTPEVIDHGQTGLLVDLFDISGYAAAVSSLLADPALRTRMGRLARERAQSLFTVKRNVADHVALYGRLLGASAQGLTGLAR